MGLGLRTDDPVYYKLKVRELVEQARSEGLIVNLNQYGIRFKSNKTGEITFVQIDEV